MHNRHFALAVAAAVWLLTVSAASASLIVGDTFDAYPVTTPPAGLPGNNGGVNGTGTWSSAYICNPPNLPADYGDYDVDGHGYGNLYQVVSTNPGRRVRNTGPGHAVDDTIVRRTISGGPPANSTIYFAADFAWTAGADTAFGFYLSIFEELSDPDINKGESADAHNKMVAMGFYGQGDVRFTSVLGRRKYTSGVLLGSTYRLVGRLTVDLSGNETLTVWKDPTSEADAPVVSDSYEYSFLHNNPLSMIRIKSLNNWNTVTIDNIAIGTDFASVVPEPAGLSLPALGGLAALYRRRR